MFVFFLFTTFTQKNDGEWHFICATWTSLNGKYEIYIDGHLRDSGNDLSTDMLIEANGTVIVGQEQVGWYQSCALLG